MKASGHVSVTSLFNRPERLNNNRLERPNRSVVKDGDRPHEIASTSQRPGDPESDIVETASGIDPHTIREARV